MIIENSDLEMSMDVLLQMRLLLMEKTLSAIHPSLSEYGSGRLMGQASPTGQRMSLDGTMTIHNFDQNLYNQWLESLTDDDINTALLEAANAACSMNSIMEDLLRNEALEVLDAMERSKSKNVTVNITADKVVGVPKSLLNPGVKVCARIALKSRETVHLPFRQTKNVAAVKDAVVAGKKAPTEATNATAGSRNESPNLRAGGGGRMSPVPGMQRVAAEEAFTWNSSSPENSEHNRSSPMNNRDGPLQPKDGKNQSRDPPEAGQASPLVPASLMRPSMSVSQLRQPTTVSVTWKECMPLKMLDESVVGPTDVLVQLWVSHSQAQDLVSRYCASRGFGVWFWVWVCVAPRAFGGLMVLQS